MMDIDLVECFLCSKSCLCCLYLFAVCSLVCCNTSPTRLCYYSSFFSYRIRQYQQLCSKGHRCTRATNAAASAAAAAAAAAAV